MFLNCKQKYIQWKPQLLVQWKNTTSSSHCCTYVLPTISVISLKKRKVNSRRTVYFCVQWHLLLLTALLSPFRNKNFPSASLSLKKKEFQSGGLCLQKALDSLDLCGVGIVVQCGSQKHVFCWFTNQATIYDSTGLGRVASYIHIWCLRAEAFSFWYCECFPKWKWNAFQVLIRLLLAHC